MRTPPPTRDEVRAHAVELGLVGPGAALSGDLYKRLARELHDAAVEQARGGPDLDHPKRHVASRVVHDAGDQWVVVEITTIPK